MDRNSDSLHPGSVIMVASRIVFACQKALLLLAAASFAVSSGSPLKLENPRGGPNRHILQGVLFEQPCGGEVDDGVIATCGNVVHNKQPR